MYGKTSDEQCERYGVKHRKLYCILSWNLVVQGRPSALLWMECAYHRDAKASLFTMKHSLNCITGHPSLRYSRWTKPDSHCSGLWTIFMWLSVTSYIPVGFPSVAQVLGQIDIQLYSSSFIYGDYIYSCKNVRMNWEVFSKRKHYSQGELFKNVGNMAISISRNILF